MCYFYVVHCPGPGFSEGGQSEQDREERAGWVSPIVLTPASAEDPPTWTYPWPALDTPSTPRSTEGSSAGQEYQQHLWEGLCFVRNDSAAPLRLFHPFLFTQYECPKASEANPLLKRARKSGRCPYPRGPRAPQDSTRPPNNRDGFPRRNGLCWKQSPWLWTARSPPLATTPSVGDPGVLQPTDGTDAQSS